MLERVEQKELQVSNNLSIPLSEVEILAIRARGPGGQNVNKVSSAVHLRFDVNASSLPETLKRRVLQLPDNRISKAGIIVIKAQRYRNRELNRDEAISRLCEILKAASSTSPRRIPTRPSKRARQRRLDSKIKRSYRKRLRGKVDAHEF